MNGYILSILGVVIAGIIIDVIVPSGTINKYIKSIFSIFVIAVIVSPVVTLLSNKDKITINDMEYQLETNLMQYIFTKRLETTEKDIEKSLNESGIKNVDIKLNYSIENNELLLNSCTVNLKNMVIVADKQHINKYEFIRQVVKQNVELEDKEIIFDE